MDQKKICKYFKSISEMFGENDKSDFGGCFYKPQSNNVYDHSTNVNNEMYPSQMCGQHGFRSPIIPHIQSNAQPPLDFGGSLTIFQSNRNEKRLDKSHWICDYSDEIFQTLRETELKRRSIWFRSQQVTAFRPMLLQLMKDAAEKHKLARTTLHLAIYLLDCFMDNYTIRSDKLNLTAITCLLVAAKIEEADMDMPKFGDLNKLVDKAYNLQEFKNVECKVLGTFNFDIIRPTAATFAEYFANSLITLQDYHMFLNHWNNEMALNQYHHYNQQLQESKQQPGLDYAQPSPHPVICTPCPYNSYEDMLTTLSKTFFALIDVSLNYLKFANARPSIIASSCIAAVRQMHGIFPTWTPYLFKLTACTADIISPFVEAILAIYRLHCKNERLQYLQTPNTPVTNGTLNSTNIICDSPDSGIVSGNDTKSMKSDTDDDVDECENAADDSDEEEDEPYNCQEYPLIPKRRRLI